MNKFFPWMRQYRFTLLLAFVAAATLLMSGCGGSDSYTEPVATRTATPLIEPETLKAWMDQGLVNANTFERVVILSVGTTTAYSAGDIPGALLWDSGSELHMPRVEALGETATMILNGATIDALLQRSGVDRFTTIVISHNGGNMMNPSRAYFTLRYWGFPKDRIKVLNGGRTAWSTAVTANGWDPAIYGVTTNVPSVAPSNFSVRDNAVLRADLRYSLGEMLQEVDRNLDDPATIGNILDARGGADFTSTTIPAGFSFQGHVANAIRDDHNQYYAGSGFKTVEDLREYLLTTLDVDPSKKFITYCVSGMRCSVPFFVIDALMGWDIAIYDGSWQQWAKYGDAKVNDAWRTDNERSVINSLTIENSNQVVDPVLNVILRDVANPNANQIENEDAEYMKPAAGSGPGVVGGGGASGC